MRRYLLEVSGLTVAYRRGLGSRADILAVRDVSFCLERGKTLGLIGESGSGKSTVLNAVAGLIKPSSGAIIWDGEKLPDLLRDGRRALRREISMLFQSAAVDHKMKIYDIIAEPLQNFEKLTRDDERLRVTELLELVRLPATLAGRRPGELSGGQLQRVGMARALALRPSLLLCDEPVSSLDIATREQMLDMLRGLCDEFNIACVFVTHDLGVARRMCDDICVMRQGMIVERGEVNSIFEHPHSLYTKLLLASILPADARQREQAREQRALLWAQLKTEEASRCQL